MKLAFLPPERHLDYTKWTNYQLVLAHKLLDPVNRRYAIHYNLMCMDNDQFIILDNGAAEGSTVSDEDLLKLARAHGVSEVVIPDVLGDSDSTLQRAQAFCHLLDVESRKWMTLRKGEGRIKFGIVAQGTTLEEAAYTIEECFEDGSIIGPWLSTIYIPRLLIERTGDPDIRMRLVHRLWSLCTEWGLEIHLLGAAPSAPFELKAIGQARYKNFIRGMDTSLPFNWALANECLQTDNGCNKVPTIKRPEGYFNMGLSLDQDIIADRNCKEMLSWLSVDTH